MSQQEFEPLEEQYGQPYYWSSTPKRTRRLDSTPENEHPSTFEPLGQQYDGDAFEHGYRPTNNVRQQVPPWARPQHHNKPSFMHWGFVIMLAAIFMKPLFFIATHVLTGIGILFGLAVLLPIILLFIVVAVLSVTAIVVLSVLGVPVWGMWRRRRFHRQWGGPWGW